MKRFVVVAVLAACLLGCVHRWIAPGGETCTIADTIACAVPCAEGLASACQRLAQWAPALLDEQGQVACATLQTASADGHPEACAREALHLFTAWQAAQAYADLCG